MTCPWVHHSRDSFDLVKWYTMLLARGQLWNASNILVLLLKLLPLLEYPDFAILFREHRFGDVGNSKPLAERSETEQLLMLTVNFNRAQALLELALGLYRKYGNDGKYGKLYEVAYSYHFLAGNLAEIIFGYSPLRLIHARFSVQVMAFRQAARFFHHETPSNFLGLNFKRFSQDLLRQDMHCYITSQLRLLLDRLKVSSNPYISYDLKTFLDIQLQSQGDFTGFIRTCDLFYTLPLFDLSEVATGLSRKASLSSEIDICILNIDTKSQISALWQSMPVFSRTLVASTHHAIQGENLILNCEDSGNCSNLLILCRNFENL